MFIKLNCIGGWPIIIAVADIAEVKPGEHGPANGGGEIGRIWRKGNLSEMPDYMTNETTDAIWEMLKPYAVLELVAPFGNEGVWHRTNKQT